MARDVPLLSVGSLEFQQGFSRFFNGLQPSSLEEGLVQRLDKPLSIANAL